jgi:hypothetical protein
MASMRAALAENRDVALALMVAALVLAAVVFLALTDQAPDVLGHLGTQVSPAYFFPGATP